MAHDTTRRQHSASRLTAERVDRCMGLAAAAIFVAVLLLGPPLRGAQALFGDQAVVGGNTFTTGTWVVPVTYYLHNNPTPPTANTNAQANLPMNTTAPTAATLYNYDANRNATAGLTILKGGSGAGETDLTKYQNWRSPVLASPLVINGDVAVGFWSAMKDFGQNKTGLVRIYIRDFNPATSAYTEIANTTVTAANWQGGSNTWVYRTASIAVSNWTLVAGRRLEVKFIVQGGAADDMWFSYDTTTYQTTVTVP